MKTCTAILFIFVLTAACLRGVCSNEATTNIATITRTINANATASKHFLLTCMGRYTSYFRSFMPYNEDPCNHTLSGKAFC